MFGASGEQTKTGLESTSAQLTEHRGLEHISGASVVAAHMTDYPRNRTQQQIFLIVLVTLTYSLK